MPKGKGYKGGSEADAARATSGRKGSSGGDKGGVGYPIKDGGGKKRAAGGRVGKKGGY